MSGSDEENMQYRVRSQALKLLARREHSRRELLLKLVKRRLPEGAVESVLDECEREGWLSDARFADLYARQRCELGYGPLRIESELQQRGVFSLPECMQVMDDADWVERAVQVRRRRFGLATTALEWDEKSREARFLSQRGFTGEQVEQALMARAGGDAEPATGAG